MTTITVIICTRDRAESLHETLMSLRSTTVPADVQAELLLIDNGSRDHTRQVAENASLRNFSLRYIFEGKRGQCHARNRGLAESKGEIIIFTDDDVRVPESWIEGITRPIVNGDADAVAGGIEIAPNLRRRWLLEGFPAFGAAARPREVRNDLLLVGANMAFSRRVLKNVPCFDIELGPGALGFGDESLFTMQLREAGYRIVAASKEADVMHHFAADRLQPHAVLDTARKMGRSSAYIHYHWQHKGLLKAGWLGRLRQSLAMLRRRIFYARSWNCEENPPYWALPVVTSYEFVRQYLQECKRPRKYSRVQNENGFPRQ